MALLDSTCLYIYTGTIMCLCSVLLDSSILNYGSTWLYVTLSTTFSMALLGSISLYYNLPWLCLALLHSTLDWLATCGSTTLLEELLMLRHAVPLLYFSSHAWPQRPLVGSILRRYWHADGLFVTRHVSFRCCRRLI